MQSSEIRRRNNRAWFVLAMLLFGVASMVLLGAINIARNELDPVEDSLWGLKPEVTAAIGIAITTLCFIGSLATVIYSGRRMHASEIQPNPSSEVSSNVGLDERNVQRLECVELASSGVQRFLASGVCGFLGMLSGIAIIEAVRPEWFRVLASDDPVFMFWSGVGGFLLSLAWWWQVMRYRIYADRTGLAQSTGFLRRTVRWEQVAWYRWEVIFGQVGAFKAPVLYDSSDRAIFRPVTLPLRADERHKEQRERLWKFVEAQLHGKHREM